MARIRWTASKIALPLAFVLSLSACQTAGGKGWTASSGPHPGLAFAQASCAGCHAVGRLGESPNPAAPPFAAVANQRGLSSETLGAWLRDAHNYPNEMQFTLDKAEVEGLVAYILTLRDPNYRPAI